MSGGSNPPFFKEKGNEGTRMVGLAAVRNNVGADIWRLLAQ